MCALILQQVQDERGEYTNNTRLSDLRCAHPELVEGLSAELNANFIKTILLFSISLELQ